MYVAFVEGNCSAGTSLAWEGPMQVGRRNDYTSYTGVESKTTQNGLLECTDRCLKVPQCVSFDAYPFVNISNPSLTTHTCYYYTALRTAAELAAPTSPQDEVTYYQWRCV
ncbi:uncharacterized protein LOC141910596 [Tubulanus polymorphus]|uniref:uncharacterized protein LOC141910596 n=1 Tax=Tubulanus polymorphus TaxID=672921 RepID=UPI003DA29EDB